MLHNEGSKGIDAKFSFYFQELIERVDPFENYSCISDTLKKENIYNNKRNRSLKYTVQVHFVGTLSILWNIYIIIICAIFSIKHKPTQQKINIVYCTFIGNLCCLLVLKSCLDTCLMGYQQKRCNCTEPKYPVNGNKCSTDEQCKFKS